MFEKILVQSIFFLFLLGHPKSVCGEGNVYMYTLARTCAVTMKLSLYIKDFRSKLSAFQVLPFLNAGLSEMVNISMIVRGTYILFHIYL